MPYSIFLPEKLTVPQPVKISQNFIELEGSSPYSQQPATGPYPEPHKNSPAPVAVCSIHPDIY
jgi:hypothetical protein